MAPSASGSKRPWRTPASSWTRSPLTSWASRAGRCWRPWSPANATPRSWPSWPRASCARSSPNCARRCGAASASTMRCWSGWPLPTWNTWKAPSPTWTAASTRYSPRSPRPVTGWTPSPGSASAPPSASSPRSASTCRCSRPPGTWQAGRAAARATTSPGASVARASPPRATAGWPMSSPSAPGPLPEAATLTWPPSSGGWPAASARRRPRSPWATPSWSSPGTCWMATATTTTSAATSSSGATATVPASGPSPSSRPSATRSPSNPPPNTRGFSFQGDPEGGQGPGGVAGVATEGGGEVDRPGAAEHADCEVAQACHDLWAGPGPHLGGVLGEGHIPHPVQAVLDRPMPADEVGQPGGAGLGEGEAGDGVDDHGPPPSGAEVSDLAGDLDDLGGVREPEVVHGDGFEGAQLDAAVAAVAGAVQHRDAMPGQAGAAVQQRGLVGLDGEQVVRLLDGDQELGRVGVGLQRVGGHDHAGKVQVGQQGLEGGHLTRRAVDLALGEHRAGGVVHRGEQVDLPALGAAGAGAAQRLAVDRHRSSMLAGLAGTVALGKPGADRGGQRLGIHAGERPADRGLGGDRPHPAAGEGIVAGPERGTHGLGCVRGPLGDP